MLEAYERAPGRGRLCIQDSTSDANHAIRPGPMRRRGGKRLRASYLQARIEWSTLSTGAERAPHFAGLNNVRAALEWCFGVNGNAEIGIGLAAAAAPVFFGDVSVY